MTLLALTTIGLALAAYLLGSIPTGVIVARSRGVDLRQVGSGNVGASNVGRALGKRFAVLVLVADAAKGALPVVAAQQIALPSWAHAVVGLCAVLGHVFSLFLRGRGGKGVATALGVALALAPLAALAAFGVYLALYLPLRISSIGSLAGAISYSGFLFAIGPTEPGYVAFGLLAAAVIVVRHRDNIKRLLSGTELRA